MKLSRLFTGLCGLALVLTAVGFLEKDFRIVAIGASPLPSGCYTDASGLAVCGPNYVGPGGTPGPGPSAIPNGTVMGNVSGVSATPVPVGVSALFDAIYGSAQGDVLYRGASAWLALAPGTNGQFLTSGGAAANISWTSASFAQATPAAGNCIGVSTPPAAGTIAYNCASPTPFPTVTGTPCSAAAGFAAGVLSVPQGCMSQGSAACAPNCAGVVLNPTPLPSPIQSASPQPGWASTQYGFFAGLGPSPNPVINVPLYYYPTIGCAGTWGGIGTTTTQANGITAGLMGLFCNGAWKFAVDGAGNVGVVGALNIGGVTTLGGTGTSHEIVFPTDSGTNCLLIPESSFAHTIKITNDTSGGCNWDMSQSVGANALLGTNSNGVTAAVGVLPSKGQVSCTLSALTCTATATVTASSRCTASYDTTATTVTAALLLPLTVGVSGTTLSVGMQGAATATGTAAADYLCF